MNIRFSTQRLIVIGPVLDSAGAAKTDEVVTNVLLSKNGGAHAALTTETFAHLHGGFYGLTLTTGNTDTLGTLELFLDSGTNTMPVVRLNVATALAWDALYAASGGQIMADQRSVLGTALTESAGGGKLAGAVVKFFNVATPTGTINSLPDAVAGASAGLIVNGNNTGAVELDSLAITGALAAGSTSLGNTAVGTWTQTGAAGWGATTFASTAFGNTTMGTLTQTGAASLGVGSTVTFATLAVTGALAAGSTSLGNTAIGTLTQTGAASLGVGSTVTFATLAVTGNYSVGGTTIHTGNVTHSALTTFTGNVLHSGTTTYAGNFLMDSYTVTNASLHTGNVTHSALTTYTGNVLHSGTTTYNGAAAYNSTETHTGAVAHNGGITTTTWAASGAVSLATTLAVSGTTTLAAINAGAIGATSITLSGVLQAATIVSTGTTTLNALTVTNACTHGSTVLGNTTMGTLTQTGAAALGVGSTVTFATLAVTGALAAGSTSLGNTTVGTLGVGAVTQTGAASLGVGSTVTYAALTVTGACTHGSTVLGNTTAGTLGIGALTQTGAASLGVGSTVTFATLAVTGAFAAGSTSLGNTTVGTLGVGALTQTGAATLGVGSTVTFATLAVTGALSVGTTTTLTGAFASTNASNDIRGVALSATGADLVLKTSTFALAMADVVWDEVLHTDHEVAGSASVLLQAAGSAADPWLTALPGAYGAGSAGYIIGGFSASSDPWNVDLPGAYSGTKAGKILADILADTATIDTAGEIAAAVWSADATTYQTQGTFGQAIGDPAADANSIYKAVVTDAGLATVGLDVVEVLTRVPNATAGEAGGLVVCGPNATLTITDVTTAGSVGKYLKDILDDTAILPGTWVVPGPGTSTLTTTDVQTYCDAAITANTLVKDIPTNGDLTTALGTAWTTAITEAYPAYDATSITPAQALYAILQSVSDFAISGLNISVKNLAGTEAMKFTMDSATVPTSRTRVAP